MEDNKRMILYNENNWVIFSYGPDRPLHLDPVELYNRTPSSPHNEYWTARVSGNNSQAIRGVPKEVRDMFFFWQNMMTP